MHGNAPWRFLAKSAAALVAAAALAMPAGAETKLVIGSWAPPTYHVNADVLQALGKWIQDVTAGRVTIEIRYNPIAPHAQFDAVRDGTQDGGWIYHGYSAAKFVATQLMELPLLGAGSEAASAAYWRIHEKYLAKADEHKGTIVLGLMTHGPGVIHAVRPIRSWADLKGVKTRLPGGIASRVGQAFGAIPVSLPAGQVFDALAAKTAEAVFMPAEGQKTFRLAEVTRHLVSVPGNLYGGSFAIIVNAKRFESLAKEDQDAIRAATGEKLSAYAGSRWAAADKLGYDAAKAAGVETFEASPQMVEELRKVTALLEADWIKRASGKGYDPAAALKELRATARALERK